MAIVSEQFIKQLQKLLLEEYKTKVHLIVDNVRTKSRTNVYFFDDITKKSVLLVIDPHVCHFNEREYCNINSKKPCLALVFFSNRKNISMYLGAASELQTENRYSTHYKKLIYLNKTNENKMSELISNYFKKCTQTDKNINVSSPVKEDPVKTDDSNLIMYLHDKIHAIHINRSENETLITFDFNNDIIKLSSNLINIEKDKWDRIFELLQRVK